MNISEKLTVITKIANGATINQIGKAKVQIKNKVVHVRFCSADPKMPGKFKFNINPNTLSADYELWICGDASIYYLIPVSVMQNIYNDANTYIDNMHPNIRVVSVDIKANTVTYASGGIKKQLGIYLRAILD